MPGRRQRVPAPDRHSGRAHPEGIGRDARPGHRGGRESQGRRLVRRHRRPASGRGRAKSHGGLQIAEPRQAARLGAPPGRAVGLQDGGHLRRGAWFRLQPRAPAEEEARRADVLERSDQGGLQGRDPDREPELLRNGVHSRRDDRADLRRGRRVPLPAAAPSQRQPVHALGGGPDQGGGPGRDVRQHQLHARRRHRGARRLPGEGPGAVRGHRLRGRLALRHQGLAQPRGRQEVRRLGADGAGAEARRRLQAVPGALEPRGSAAARGATVRRHQADQLRLREVRCQRQRKRLLERWEREVNSQPK